MVEVSQHEKVAGSLQSLTLSGCKNEQANKQKANLIFNITIIWFVSDSEFHSRKRQKMCSWESLNSINKFTWTKRRVYSKDMYWHFLTCLSHGQAVSLISQCFTLCTTGQFSNEPSVKVYDLHEGTDPEKKQATMEVKGNKLTVTR